MERELEKFKKSLLKKIDNAGSRYQKVEILNNAFLKAKSRSKEQLILEMLDGLKRGF